MDPGESSSRPGASTEEGPPEEGSRPAVPKRKRWKMQFRLLVVNPFPRLFSRPTAPPQKMASGGQMVGSTQRYDDQPYFEAERSGASGGQTEPVHQGFRRPDHPERDAGRSELQVKEGAEAEARLRGPPVIQRSCDLDCRHKSRRRTIDASPEYLAYRKQVAAELVEKQTHSVGKDLLRLRQGRKETVKQLQEFGYLDSDDVEVDDADVIRAFDHLCRDVAKWRHDAIVTLRQRRGRPKEGSDAEKQLLQLKVTRQCVDNYKKRSDRILAARDQEIESLKLELEMAKELCLKLQCQPLPSNDGSLSYKAEVSSRLFRGCLSSDDAFWARKTAVFPELMAREIRERIESDARKKAAEKAAETEQRKAKDEEDDDDDYSQLKRRVELQRKLETNFVIEDERK